MLKYLIFFTLLSQIHSQIFSQNNYKYWIGFADKNNNSYSINSPEDFLSTRAVERRERYNIPYDLKDLPVTEAYVDSIRKYYPNIKYASKWLNGVVVETDLPIVESNLMHFDFIKQIRKIYSKGLLKSGVSKFYIKENTSVVYDINSLYGESFYNFQTINGGFLHGKGFKGENMLIAILDAGFRGVTEFGTFDSLWINNRIMDSRDFVSDTVNIFNAADHGMHVLSILGGYFPGYQVGSAPNASYCLIRTEDVSSEFPVEEYNWVRGAEYADSIGADVINSSLGYYIFDDSLQSYSYQDLNGDVAISTQGADIAASKGILVCSSAGNEGNKPWHYILAPGDGDSVMSVGAINKYKNKAGFSSFGPRVDGEIKPNVMALGDEAVIQIYNGSFNLGNGTSYASPVMAGMAACLWQAFPEYTNMDIFHAIEQSCDNYNNPSDSMGYGIPDFVKAYAQLYKFENQNIVDDKKYEIFPNPFSETLTILIHESNFKEIRIQVISLQGKLLFSTSYELNNTGLPYIKISDFSNYPTGVYFLRIESEKYSKNFKIFKN